MFKSANQISEVESAILLNVQFIQLYSLFFHPTAGMNMNPVSRLKKTWGKVNTDKFEILEVRDGVTKNARNMWDFCILNCIFVAFVTEQFSLSWQHQMDPSNNFYNYRTALRGATQRCATAHTTREKVV